MTEGGNLDNLKRKPGKYSPSMTKLLKKIRDEPIKYMKVVRTPLSSAVKDLLGLISLGTYDQAVKESGYDTMFHIALFINNRYTLDKQSVVKLVVDDPITKDSQAIGINVSRKGLTIGGLIEKTRLYMGDEKFSNYDAHTNNCQVFVMAVLDANGLSSETIKKFVMQDADAVFSKMPEFSEKIVKTFTDIGAVADKIIEGGAGKNKISSNKEMSWREFWSNFAKGKKFGSRKAVNDAMKKAAVEWRKKHKK